jgi:hypothetical protein
MTNSEKLRNLHITILAAFEQANNIEIYGNGYKGDKLLEIDMAKDNLMLGIECIIFNELAIIKNKMGIDYAPIEHDEIISNYDDIKRLMIFHNENINPNI